MTELIAPFLAAISIDSPIDQLSQLLDSCEKNLIGIAPWPQYTYKPHVHFVIAYGCDSVFIKYYVSEKSVKAIYGNPNEPVYKDSCVEFFVSFANEQGYYNFEFNCAGTCRVGFGTGKSNRTLLPDAVVRMIKHQALLMPVNNSENGNVSWELTLMIPFEVFHHHSLVSLDAQQCRVNFYKCGDELPDPHFLAWNDIRSAHPDFHLPEFFGKMLFEKSGISVLPLKTLAQRDKNNQGY